MSTYENWLNERPHYRGIFPSIQEMERYQRRFVRNTFMPNNQTNDNAGADREMTATERMMRQADELGRELRQGEEQAIRMDGIRRRAEEGEVINPPPETTTTAAPTHVTWAVDWDEVPAPLRMPRVRPPRPPEGLPFVDEAVTGTGAPAAQQAIYPYNERHYDELDEPYKMGAEGDHFL